MQQKTTIRAFIEIGRVQIIMKKTTGRKFTLVKEILEM